MRLFICLIFSLGQILYVRLYYFQLIVPFNSSCWCTMGITYNVLQAGERPTFHKIVPPKIKHSFYKQNVSPKYDPGWCLLAVMPSFYFINCNSIYLEQLFFITSKQSSKIADPPFMVTSLTIS